MDHEEYKVVLLAKEQELLHQEERFVHTVQDEAGEEVREWSDEGVMDEDTATDLKEASELSALLHQVRDALKRIANGTFGNCKVDGKPIEEARLKQIPWTPYCLKHQEEIERGSQQPAATL